ncbi:MAG: SCP2 sterol-binding domain-containing protein [Candidatus Lokiarchaeota archaeon]|nr:SCP2 sterol-binding domain-containing protein [Candidatus Lokiarchaeota archaeon]
MSEDKIQRALKLERKRVDGTLKASDVYDYLKAISWISNQSVYAEDELFGLEKVLQFNLLDIKNFWLKIENNKLKIGEGVNETPDVTVKMSEEGAVKYFSRSSIEYLNENATLFRSGAISLKGNPADFNPLLILLRGLMAIAAEELKDLEAKL